MAKTETNPTPEGAPAAPAPPPHPTARDVVLATSAIVTAVEHLPPPLQLRAIHAALAALGLDRASREQREQRKPDQQRQGNSNQSNGQQNNGQARGNR